MLKLLHFADAHIDIATHGKHDPVTGLPLRVLDFLKALDTIVDTAVSEKVDLVIFAGDAYKDRTPAPTFQREWGKRIMRLSDAGIPTILLVGNHDISPATGRAHTLQEFATLAVPHIHVIDKPVFLKPADLEGLPVQVLGLPWIFSSFMVMNQDISGKNKDDIFKEFENNIYYIYSKWLEQLDPSLPTIFIAHGSVMGAEYGYERNIMLGKDFILPGSIIFDPRIDYVALGHIHKSQDLNLGGKTPVIYPGSIERVDFGEEKQEKYFVIANIEKGNSTYELRKLNGRKFLTKYVKINNGDNAMELIYSKIPQSSRLNNICFRLVIEYPRNMDALIDEKAIRDRCKDTFEFHLIRRPHEESRLRLPEDKSLTTIPPLELLSTYFSTIFKQSFETDSIKDLAASIIESAVSGQPPEEE
jgi:exonuclease SbcD